MDDSDRSTVKVVAGLGNPGPPYARTRHNVGFMVVEELVRRWGLGSGRKAFGGLFFEGQVASGKDDIPPQRVLLLEPHTFMNCSGQAVKSLAAYYRVACEDVLIVLDDLALPPGRIRLRAGGSPGGHKGLADVVRLMGTEQVPRLRIGIGEAPEYLDARDFVLQPMDEDEAHELQRAVAVAARAVEEWLFEPLGDVMGTYNGMTV